jgi:hypothetical protein
MPAKQKPLGFRCPICGRENGSLRKKILIRRKVDFKTRTDFGGNRYTEEIKPLQNPYKYLSIILTEGQIRILKNPTISRSASQPPKTNSPSKTQEAILFFLRNLKKFMHCLYEILQSVYVKFPRVRSIEENLTSGLRFLFDILESAVDDRYRRNLIEWLEIISIASEKSPRVASKEYAGHTTDGKSVSLSPRFIRRKKPQLEEFLRRGALVLPRFCEAIDTVLAIIDNDAELSDHLQKIAKDFDDQEEDQRDDRAQEKELPFKQDVYYYVRHYDANLYNKKKQEKDKGKHGKIECGPFREVDINFLKESGKFICFQCNANGVLLTKQQDNTYLVEHYDHQIKGKRRWCNAQLWFFKCNDLGYIEFYEPLIHIITERQFVKRLHKEKQNILYRSAASILEEVGFRSDMVYDKLVSDSLFLSAHKSSNKDENTRLIHNCDVSSLIDLGNSDLDAIVNEYISYEQSRL